MRTTIPAWTIILALGLANPVLSQEAAIGRTVDSLLDYARNNNPEYASMRRVVMPAHAITSSARANGGVCMPMMVRRCRPWMRRRPPHTWQAWYAPTLSH